VVKVKTSIYIDRDLWSSFKEYASKSGVEVGKILEELIKDSLIEAELDKTLAKIEERYEIDFNPVEPIGGPISTLVRTMKDERADRVFRR